MIEPVEMQNFFITFFSAAMVVIMGALYALLFAWSRLHKTRGLMLLAYAAYAGLFVSVMILANATNLEGYWKVIVVIMLIGYLLAPHGIWHLSVGTHASGQEVESRTGSANEIRAHQR